MRAIKRQTPWSNAILLGRFPASTQPRWVKGEGAAAYARLRAWEPGKPDPSPPSKRVVMRGDLAWPGEERTASDGTAYTAILVGRRGDASGWIPTSALVDEHPLVTLTTKLEPRYPGKDDNPRRDKEKQYPDKKFDDKSCTHGAFMIQNWLRGYYDDDGNDAPGGPLKKVGGTGAAQKLIAWGLEKKGKGTKIAYYHQADPSKDPKKTLVKNPNAPLTWLWPGDLIALCRTRGWNGKELESVPYKRGIYDENVIDDPDYGSIEYGFSGHIATIVDFVTKGGNYEEIHTLEAHLSSTWTEGETYALNDLLYWGSNCWGLITVRAKDSDDAAAVTRRTTKAWEGEWWLYHKKIGEQFAAKAKAAKDAGDDDAFNQHDAKRIWNEAQATKLFKQECRRRGVPEIDHTEAATFANADSGLELFGFGYWKDG